MFPKWVCMWPNRWPFADLAQSISEESQSAELRSSSSRGSMELVIVRRREESPLKPLTLLELKNQWHCFQHADDQTQERPWSMVMDLVPPSPSGNHRKLRQSLRRPDPSSSGPSPTTTPSISCQICHQESQ